MTTESILHRSRFELRAEEDNVNLDENELDRLSREGRWGFIHSQETGSSVDGPGVRVVYWTTGCEFRCLYCHNPDTWKLKHGQLVCVDDILTDLKKYAGFLKLAKGGFTVSGGEPLVQDRFVMNLMRGAKELGLHTALDTNGFLGDKLSDEDLNSIDLVLLDIKSWDPETHLRTTAKPVEPVLAFARRLAERKHPVWLRFVLVPGLTDATDNIDGVAKFAASLGNIERVDVLPFHQLGKFKWEALGMKYELADTKSPTNESVDFARAIFRRYGLNCPT
ncbi:pyruvate formate-lyase-activating protein [Uliginosibacterium sp. H3]|uniref:Pyruvate formate-lyase-activating enzyme n=1 Tax=Uliginosibacterium silvisoli TaxID=3114758 RepID=A0ABU6K0X3_9RHOO|nr:pyruvate formate-lyase-activating protein [Uliginosibacterium sp. H3]